MRSGRTKPAPVAVLIVSVVGLGVVAPSLRAGAPSAPAGLYTEDQARRGMSAYIRACSACHGEQFNGAESGPPLAGGEFLDQWRGRPVSALFDKIRQTMPPLPDTPGRLGDQGNLDVIAAILSVNELPAGTRELGPGDLGSVPVE